MNVIKTDIEGVLIIEPQVFGDERGYFFESFNAEHFRAQTGVEVTFVQDNESRSKGGGVTRFALPEGTSRAGKIGARGAGQGARCGG